MIISKESFESSTENVIDWIITLGHNFIRINGEMFERKNESFELNSGQTPVINIHGKPVQGIYSLWFRRWSDFESVDEVTDSFNKSKIDIGLAKNISDNITNDYYSILNNIFKHTKPKKTLSGYDQINVNKFNVLLEAKKLGILIPDSIITNKKKTLLNFSRLHPRIVIKDLNFPFHFNNESIIYSSFVELLDGKMDKIPDSFCLAFFQEYIDKQYEIRTFFLGNNLYSMAIFSQNNDLTKVDFRKYSLKNPNRTVPYKLPINLEKKIKRLIKAVKLQTGSIDLVKGKNGKYYFLEVNPVGQFGMVSTPCNYNLERKVAEHLTE